MTIKNIEELRNQLLSNFTMVQTKKMSEHTANAATKKAHAVLKTISLEQNELRRIGNKKPIRFMQYK